MPALGRLIVYLLATLLASTSGLAQSSPESAPTAHEALTNLLAPGYLEDQLSAVTNQTNLPAEARAAVARLYTQCIGLKKELQDLDAERAQLVSTASGASNQLYEVNQALSQPVVEAALDLPEDASAQALEQKASEVQAELQLAQAEHDRLEKEPKRRTDRRVKIAELLAEYRSALKDLEAPATDELVGKIPEEFSQAVDDYRLLQRAVYLYRIRNLNLELASFSATADLLLARQALASRRLQLLKDQLSLLKQATNEKRAAESAQAAEDARLARQRAEALRLPIVTSLAASNQALARTRVAVSEQLEQTSADLDTIEAEWNEILTSYGTVKEQVEAVQESGIGQNFAIGLALRQEQYTLPSQRRQETQIQECREQMARAQLHLLKVGHQRREYADLEPHLSEVRQALPADLSEGQREQAMAECRRLLEEQRSLLSDLFSDYSALCERLSNLTRVQEQYLATIDEFRSYISERVLWIQSTDRLSLRGIRKEFRAIRRILGAELREGLGPYLSEDWSRHRYVYGCALMVLIALLGARVLLARGLRLTCPTHLAEGRLSLRPAALALLCTVLLAVPLPALLAFLAWRFQGHTGSTELAEQWTHAFFVMATGVLVLEFIRQACRQPGLALAHLRWPLHNVRLVRFHFTWFIAVGVPLGIITDLLEGVFGEDISNRLPFITGQCLILLFAHWMLRSPQGLRFNTHDGEARVEGSLRFQRFYHLVAVATPITLITLSVLGYTYTARHIWIRVGDSIQWGMIVLVVTLLVLHWLTVMRRRLAVRKAELRRSSEQEKEAQQQPGPDIWQVYSASRRLFSTILWIIMAIGLWVIWSDMLPALKKLDRTPLPFVGGGLIQRVDLPDLQPTSPPPDGGSEEAVSESAASQQPVPLSPRDFVSVGDLLLAVLVVVLTIATSRHLPGFVEMVLLSRVRFRQGEGYAIVTILRYVVLLVGFGWALTLIGITWNKVQWLAAAITVGIGFGLQEIFANFVSGLILLFERPVRVGDIITVGDVSGKVTQIKMRATTVRNWDQQELVLPNKDLVTGRVINWTLSDDVSRLALTVGLSYKADVARASELLLQIARENSNVADAPEPFVTFEKFADSTLDVVLRAYVSIQVRLATLSQLNNAILERFREAGIEIAYPQRDLHLRSVAADLPPLPSPAGAGDPPAPSTGK